MATNNFKLFDENKANMMGDTEYGVNPQRLNGVQTGVASSELNNKFAYQMSLVAYSIAQMMNANGIDANDTQAVSAFVNGLSSTVMQKVLDKATEEMAIAGTDNSHYMTPALVNKVSSLFQMKVEDLGVLHNTIGTTVGEVDLSSIDFGKYQFVFFVSNDYAGYSHKFNFTLKDPDDLSTTSTSSTGRSDFGSVNAAPYMVIFLPFKDKDRQISALYLGGTAGYAIGQKLNRNPKPFSELKILRISYSDSTVLWFSVERDFHVYGIL